APEPQHELCRRPDEWLVEPQFGAQYWTDPIPEPLMESWNAALRSGVSAAVTAGGAARSSGGAVVAGAAGSSGKTVPVAAAAEVSLALPQPNPFIPTDFTLRELPPGIVSFDPEAEVESDVIGGVTVRRHKPAAPRLHGAAGGDADVAAASAAATVAAAAAAAGAGMADSSADAAVKLWHLQDAVFRTPRAEMYVKIVAPLCVADARSAALCDLLVRLVDDALTEYAYMASVAELHYGLKCTDVGFQVHVSGFDHKAPALLREVLGRLLGIREPFTVQAVAMQREALLRAYANTDLKPS
ncbi:unnamed protein product, partial [Phaeothamnion confervicola]